MLLLLVLLGDVSISPHQVEALNLKVIPAAIPDLPKLGKQGLIEPLSCHWQGHTGPSPFVEAWQSGQLRLGLGGSVPAGWLDSPAQETSFSSLVCAGRRCL